MAMLQGHGESDRPDAREPGILFGPAIARARAVAPVVAVLLTGSRARGDAVETSDHDLVLIVDGPASGALRATRELKKAGDDAAADVVVDVFAHTRTAFEERLGDALVSGADPHGVLRAVLHGVALAGGEYLQALRARHASELGAREATYRLPDDAPDPRDGLSFAERRLLGTLVRMGVTSRGPFARSARAVHECFEALHPFGRGRLYHTLIGMCVPWRARYPLLEGHGNLGSAEGDPPAGMRYTELRLTPLADELLADAALDATPRARSSGGAEEPAFLPVRLPIALLNGSRTSPPHDLGDVCDAVLGALETPEGRVDEGRAPSLRELVRAFVAARLAVIVRRAHVLKVCVERRLALTDALLGAARDIEGVTGILASAATRAEARDRLRAEYGWSDDQVDGVLREGLASLTADAAASIRTERASLVLQVSGPSCARSTRRSSSGSPTSSSRRRREFVAAEGDFAVTLPRSRRWRLDEEQTQTAAGERMRLANPATGALLRVLDDPHPAPEAAVVASGAPIAASASAASPRMAGLGSPSHTDNGTDVPPRAPASAAPVLASIPAGTSSSSRSRAAPSPPRRARAGAAAEQDACPRGLATAGRELDAARRVLPARGRRALLVPLVPGTGIARRRRGHSRRTRPARERLADDLEPAAAGVGPRVVLPGGLLLRSMRLQALGIDLRTDFQDQTTDADPRPDEVGADFTAIQWSQPSRLAREWLRSRGQKGGPRARPECPA
ncbi:MAG TPA: DNA gyrase subunit A [Planctomycetota bacterium]|nr:DNA gyrase subunit A [Planctomycetota bacterium]